MMSGMQDTTTSRLLLLGAPMLLRDGQAVAFRTRKALALLCYLAASPGPHPRERLLTLLWPDADEQRGRANLRTALLYLRAALGPTAGMLHADGDRLALTPSPMLDIDLTAVEATYALSATSRSKDARGVGASALSAAVATQLAHAADLYRGPFLDGLTLPDAPEFETWAQEQRVWWTKRARALSLRLAAIQREDGAPEAAAETLERWLRHESGDEGAWQTLLTAYGDAGDAAAVRDAYARCQAALRATLDVAPDARTYALAAAALAQATPSLPPQPTTHEADATGAWFAGSLPLVGRGREMAALRAAYARTAASHPTLAALLGQAGMGKTRLARELAQWATAQGATVLEGRAYATGAGLPYAPLTAALRVRLERENAPDDLLADVWLAELARLLPELHERYPDLPSPLADPALGQSRLFEAVARLLAALAARGPLLLVLDDAQWADTGTRDLTRYLMRGWSASAQATTGTRVLLLVTSRTEDAGLDTGLAEWFAALARDAADGDRDAAILLDLGPLDQRDTMRLTALLSELEHGAQQTLGRRGGVGAQANGKADAEAVGAVGAVGTDMTERLGAWLYTRTGGQPFYLTEMLRTLLETGAIGLRAARDGGWALDLAPMSRQAAPASLVALSVAPPLRVQEAIRARLGRLAGATVALLRAGAILGSSFGFVLACQVAAVDEETGLVALDEARPGLLLREVGDANALGTDEKGMVRYEFGHDLVREVVYQDIGQARRVALHRRALTALEGEGAPAAELARHALAAGADEAAFRHSLQAGHDSLAVFAIQDGIAHYERARRLIERGVMAKPEALVRLYANLGRAYDVAGARDAARGAYDALRAYGRRVNDSALQAEALNLYLTRAGLHFDEAQALLEEAASLDASAFGPAADAETHLNMAQVAVVAWRLDVAAREAECALTTARAEDLAELAGHSLFLLALVALWSSRYDDARMRCMEAIATFRALRMRGAGTATPPLRQPWAGAPWSLPSDEPRLRVLEAHCNALLACVEVNRGEAAAAQAAGYLGLQLAEEAHDDWDWGLIAANLAIALIEGGEYAEARRVEERAGEIARTLPITDLRPNVPLWSGMTRLALLDLAQARTATLEALHAPAQTRAATLEALRLLGPEVSSTRLWRAIGLSLLCATSALVGEWGEAAAYARAAAAAREQAAGDLLAMDFARHYETEALLRDGDEAAARNAVERLAALVGANRRHRLVLTRMRAAIAHWEGNTAGAIEHLEASLELASLMGLPGEQWAILADLAALHRERGEAPEATRMASEACAIVEALAARLGETGHDAAFRAHALARIAGQAIAST